MNRSNADLSLMPGGYIAIAVGAFLDFAVKASLVIFGINFRTVGFILISVGSLSVFLPVISNVTVGLRHKRTIIEDDGGYGHRRGDIIPERTLDYGKREGTYTDPDRNLIRSGSPLRRYP